VDRLLRILNSAQHPHDRDLASVVLAYEVGRAQTILKGRKHRGPRARLEMLAAWVGERDRQQSVANAVLYDGLRAIRLMTDENQATSFASPR
jgi:hypothetical protein